MEFFSRCELVARPKFNEAFPPSQRTSEKIFSLIRPLTLKWEGSKVRTHPQNRGKNRPKTPVLGHFDQFLSALTENRPKSTKIQFFPKIITNMDPYRDFDSKICQFRPQVGHIQLDQGTGYSLLRPQIFDHFWVHFWPQEAVSLTLIYLNMPHLRSKLANF